MSTDPKPDNETDGVSEHVAGDEVAGDEARILKLEGMRLSSILLTIAVTVLALYVGFNWLQARQASKHRSRVLDGKFSEAMAEGHSFFREAEANGQAPTVQLRLWHAAITSVKRAQALAALPDADEGKRNRVDEFLADLQKEEAKTKQLLELATENRALLTLLEDLRIPREDDLRSTEAKVRETLRQDAAYEAAFKTHGILEDASFEKLRRRFAGQTAATISQALDHWTLLRRRLKKPEAVKLAKLASRLYPQNWREQLRHAHSVGKADRATLQRLHKEFRYDRWPVANAIYLAESCVNNDDLDTALSIYESASRHAPGLFALSLQLAILRERVDPPRWDDAARAYEVASALRPQQILLRRRLGRALALAGKHKAALPILEDVLMRSRRDIALLRLAGISSQRSGALERAVSLFGMLVQQASSDASAHALLGSALLELGELPKSHEAFDKALGLVKDEPRYWLGMGRVLAAMKQGKASIVALGQAVKLDANFVEGHLALARQLQAGAAFTLAEKSFRHAIALEPYRAALHLELGDLLAEKEDMVAARRAYQDATELDAGYAEAWERMGDLMQGFGRYIECLEYYRRCHEVGSRRGKAWTKASADWIENAERLAKIEKAVLPLLEGRVPSLLPSDWVEAIDLGLARRAYVAVVRVYERAIKKAPQILDYPTRPREKAARAAAMAGLGLGHDAIASPKERAKLRNMAMTLLRQELGYWQDEIARDIKIRSNLARATLRAWMSSKYFAGLFEEEALKKLPKEEADAWRAFWQEVKFT